MPKDPRFNFYPDNYAGGTRRMTFEQKGAYIELIILNFYCFSDGLAGFTKEDALNALASAAACADLWIFLTPKFSTDGTYYWSERLLKEFTKAKINSEKQSEKAKKRWCDAAASTAADAYNGYGSGNGIDNGIELKEVEGENKILTQKEIHDLVFAEPMFLQRLQDSHPGKDYERAFAECYAYFMNRPNPPNVLWVWRQKLLTWLSNTKDNPRNGASTLKPIKKKLTVEDLEKRTS